MKADNFVFACMSVWYLNISCTTPLILITQKLIIGCTSTTTKTVRVNLIKFGKYDVVGESHRHKAYAERDVSQYCMTDKYWSNVVVCHKMIVVDNYGIIFI